MIEYRKILLDLQLFDGEGGGDGAAGADGGGTAAAAAGDQGNAKAVETAAPSAEDAVKARKEAFETRIKGEDKDFFDERVQTILKHRFKDGKKLETQLEKQQNVLNLLANRYPNIDTGDPDAVLAAMEKDETIWERYAEENGLTQEQAKKFARMEQENARYRNQEAQARQQQEAQRIYAGWQTEANALKQTYGAFDLQGETRHPVTGERFVNLLKNGVDMKTAYEVIHKDELLTGAIRTAVQTTQKKVSDDIKARGQRPGENGLEASKGVATRIDVHSLTNDQLKELSEKARNSGKRIIIDKDGIREV